MGSSIQAKEFIYTYTSAQVAGKTRHHPHGSVANKPSCSLAGASLLGAW
jgi:hypothetical protein